VFVAEHRTPNTKQFVKLDEDSLDDFMETVYKFSLWEQKQQK